MIKREESLKYHSSGRRGKIEIHPTKACLTPREMRLCYLPGASFPSSEIIKDSANVFKYTSKEILLELLPTVRQSLVLEMLVRLLQSQCRRE